MELIDAAENAFPRSFMNHERVADRPVIAPAGRRAMSR
jgi:hypothetical protein